MFSTREIYGHTWLSVVELSLPWTGCKLFAHLFVNCLFTRDLMFKHGTTFVSCLIALEASNNQQFLLSPAIDSDTIKFESRWKGLSLSSMEHAMETGDWRTVGLAGVIFCKEVKLLTNYSRRDGFSLPPSAINNQFLLAHLSYYFAHIFPFYWWMLCSKLTAKSCGSRCNMFSRWELARNMSC